MSSLTTSLPLSTAYQQPPPRPQTANPPHQQLHHHPEHLSALPRSAYAYTHPGQPVQAQPYVFKTEPTTPPLQPYYSTPSYSIPYSGPQQRPHTSHTYPTQRYVMSSPDRPSAGEQSQGYQQPMTPISGSEAHYSGPAPPAVSQFYGVAASNQHMPSPPPTSSGRPTSANFTPDGLPIVPVGISGGKMFRCKGFGECDKVFTRSEHLARHVRKHTGERPFPCHCGKAFSRLDNLRQHAATVHADQATRNDQMLNELSAVHAALSQKANKEQRKRGEIVEVPKNAVERPRTTEVSQRAKRSNSVNQSQGPPMNHGGQYPYPPPGTGGSTSSVQGHGGWGMPAQGRPRTGSGWDYSPYPSGSGAGPSNGPMSEHPDDRRPSSSASAMGGFPGYQPYYPPNSDNRGPPPAQSSSGEPMSQLPYPFRPISSNGRELPVPVHYAADEAGQQGPPGSGWQSPQPAFGPSESSSHEGGHMYPPQEHGGNHGPYPAEPYPSSHSQGYYYPPQQQQQGYYPPSQYPNSGPPSAQQPHYPPVYQGGQGPPPQEPPYPYSGQSQQQYPPYGYDQPAGRKRRADEEAEDDAQRVKQPRSHEDLRSGPSGLHPNHAEGPRDPSWLPPTNERRSSLAISALLGSPQEAPRTRPPAGSVPIDPGSQPYLQNYSFGRVETDGHPNGSSAPPTPVLPQESEDKAHGLVNDMDAKAKALLELGQPETVAN